MKQKRDKDRVFFARNLKKYLEQSHLRQYEIAERLGVTAQAVSDWKKGKAMPRADKINELAKILNVSTSDLIGLQAEYTDRSAFEFSGIGNLFQLSKKKFPLIGTISCGTPILAQQNVEDYIESSDTLNADFCLKCKGDSMIDAGIKNGDIVYIRQQPDVENGEIAAVIIDGEATLKRVNKSAPGFILLEPANTKYDTIVIDLKNQNHDTRIVGKAIGMQRIFR